MLRYNHFENAHHDNSTTNTGVPPPLLVIIPRSLPPATYQRRGTLDIKSPEMRTASPSSCHILYVANQFSINNLYVARCISSVFCCLYLMNGSKGEIFTNKFARRNPSCWQQLPSLCCSIGGTCGGGSEWVLNRSVGAPCVPHPRSALLRARSTAY